MIGHGYWSRVLQGFVGVRVQIYVGIPLPEGGMTRRPVTGEILSLDTNGVLLLADDKTTPKIKYDQVLSVEHPPPGEGGRP